jgi:peptidoglycan/xylan/chitin deacetylase (PgdA/CDA1 family)
MVWHTVPSIVKRIFPRRTWNGEATDNQIYLSFDDGPVPGVTEFVLDELAKREQLATFFVVGDNVRKNPALARRILESGHQIGNHTYHHLSGWKTDLLQYLEDVSLCQEILKNELGFEAKLFRPPYGLMTHAQAKQIEQRFQIIMWNVLSGDYSKGLDASEILTQTSRNSAPGSIVVFHDQEKTSNVLPKFLPLYLDYVMDQGFKAVTL